MALNSPEARDLAHHLHSFTHLPSLERDGPLVLERGEGIYVHDTHGKRYLESVSGLWNIVAGFSEQRLVQAAHEALQQLPAYHTFFGRTALTPVALAEKLVEIAPMAGGARLLHELGVGGQRHHHQDALDDGQEARASPSGASSSHARWPITARPSPRAASTASPTSTPSGCRCRRCVYAEAPHHWRNAHPGESEEAYAERLAAELEALIEAEGPETIAGFFAEPVMGAGGAVPPPAGYFPRVQAVLNRHGIPLVADEVVTGLGRTGNLWGAETYDFTPDIVVTSKALTSGYQPMAAVLLSEEMDRRLHRAAEEFDEFPHGFTTGGSPVAAAVALETIALITEPGGLLDNVRAVAPTLKAALQRFEDHPLVGEVRHVGLLGALEIVADKGGKRPFAPEHEIGERIVQAAYARGLITRPIGDAVIIAPPFMITGAQIEELITTLGAVLDEIADAATREGMGPVPLAASAE